MSKRKDLQAEIEVQKAEIKTLKDERLKSYKIANENQELRAANTELTDKINKLSTQIREQTEADLFFVSAKICFELFKGKPKKEIKSQLERQGELQRFLLQEQARAAMLCGLFGM